jgi:hypothetical protein
MAQQHTFTTDSSECKDVAVDHKADSPKATSSFNPIPYNKDYVLTSNENQWRPYPWCLWPDWITSLMGVVLFVPVVPLMLLFLVSMVWKKVMNFLCDHVSLIGKIPHLIYEELAPRVARILMKDERNSSYLPLIFGLGIMCPCMLSFAAYRL